MKIFLFFLTPLFYLNTSAHTNLNQQKIDKLLSEISETDVDSVKVRKYISVSELSLDGTPEKLQYIQSALIIAEKGNWNEGIGICYYHLGWYYFFDNNKEFATECFLKATQYSDDITIKVYSYGLIANSYSWDGNHDTAMEYAMKGWRVVEFLEPSIVKCDALVFLGDVYRYKGDDKMTKHCYLHGLDMLNQVDPDGWFMSRMTIYTYLNDTAIDDPFSVFRFSLKIKRLYDHGSPMDRMQYSLSLVKLVAAYTKVIESDKIGQVRLEAKEKQNILYACGIALLLVTVLLSVWQNHSRKKTNKQLILANAELQEANEMKSRFFGILNHDLRRPVAGLISYLELRKEIPDLIERKDAEEFEQKTIDAAENLLENMENLLFWCKSQMQNFTPRFIPIEVSKLFTDTESFFINVEDIKFIYDSKEDIILTTDENYVKTIMRNLTSNSIKVLDGVAEPIIRWNAWKENGNIILSITNNGLQMPKEKIDLLYGKNQKENITEGLGLRIIRDLAKVIDCKIEIASNNDKGTTFFLIFKE